MITRKAENCIKRLFLKIAKYIGPDCYRYLSFLFRTRSPSSVELEILEGILTSGLYAEEAIEAACITAFDQKVTEIVEFEILVFEVNGSFFENA